MRQLLKLGLYVAAGYGTYEILRRAGVLDKAGHWLQDNVPEDVKTKIRDHVQRARDEAQHLKGQATQQLGSLRGQAQEQYQNLKTRATEGYSAAREQATNLTRQAGERLGHAREVVSNKLHGNPASAGTGATGGTVPNEPVAEEYDSAHSTDASGIGQTITGPGRGADDATVEVNGGSVHHRVGRGVVHG